MSLQEELRDARVSPGTPPPRFRWDLLAAWAVILGPTLAIAVWLGLRQRVGDLEERLVRDANAAFSRPVARPVHVDAPAPGTFGDAVAHHLPAIQRWADSVKDDSKAREAARDVVAGKRPLAQLPPSYEAAVRDLAPALDGLLAGTHAGSLDLPLAPEKWEPCSGAGWDGYQAAALLAGLRARGALAAGDAPGAMTTCLDGLALGRDAAISSSLVGHMVGAAVVKRLWPPCREALARLGGREADGAVTRLRAVRDAIPSVTEMLRVDLLGTEVVGFGRELTHERRARLVPLAAAQIPSERLAPWERAMARDGWRSSRASWDALLRVSALNRGLTRDAGILAVMKEAERRVNPLAAIVTPGGHAKYARRAEAAIARLDLLLLAAATARFREEAGRWPTSVAEPAARGWLTALEAERLSEARLSGARAGEALLLKLAVRTGDEKEPEEELGVEVRPPARARPAGAR